MPRRKSEQRVKSNEENKENSEKSFSYYATFKIGNFITWNKKPHYLHDFRILDDLQEEQEGVRVASVVSSQ